MRKRILLAVVVSAFAALVYVSNSGSPTVSGSFPGAPITTHETAGNTTATREVLPSVIAQAEPIIPNKDSMVIRWYKRPQQAFTHPNGSPSENFRYLKALAETGDGFAAHQLANMVLGCSHGSFQTQQALDTAMSQMRKTFTYSIPETGHLVRANNAQEAEIFINTATKQFEVCKEVTGNPRDAYKKWLEIGVNDGHTVAMLDYGNRLKDPQAAVGLFRSAWLQGDPYALHTLADGLQEMYDDGIDPAAKIPAYAAMHAFVTLHSSVYSANTESVIGRIALDYRSKLSEMARDMLPDELETAVEQSKELIASNENCCYSM